MTATPAGHVTVAQHGSAVVIALHGEHDMATAADVRRALWRHVTAGRAIVVDLEPTEFVDLTVMGALLQADESLRQHGARLVLRLGTGPSVHRLLELTGLQERFEMVGGLAEAIRRAQEQPGTSSD